MPDFSLAGRVAVIATMHKKEQAIAPFNHSCLERKNAGAE